MLYRGYCRGFDSCCAVGCCRGVCPLFAQVHGVPTLSLVTYIRQAHSKAIERAGGPDTTAAKPQRKSPTETMISGTLVDGDRFVTTEWTGVRAVFFFPPYHLQPDGLTGVHLDSYRVCLDRPCGV